MKAQICRPRDHNIFSEGNDTSQPVRRSANDQSPQTAGDSSHTPIKCDLINAQTSNSCSANIKESGVVDQNDGIERLFIRGGRLVSSEYVYEADILVENGRIRSIGSDMRVSPGIPTIDASGCIVMPGGVDFATFTLLAGNANPIDCLVAASQQAIVGGTTCIIDTVHCPPGDSAVGIVRTQLQKLQASGAKTNILCEYGLRIGITEITETLLFEMDELVNALGVVSFLFFPSALGSLDNYQGRNQLVQQAFSRCRALGAVATVCLHTLEELNNQSGGQQQSAKNEAKLAETAILVGSATGCPLVLIGLRHAATLELVARAKRSLPRVHVDAVLAETSLEDIGSANQTAAPSLAYLAAGDIACIASEASKDTIHCGNRMSETWRKSVHHGWLDLPSFVNVMAKRPAQLSGFGLAKGRLAVGSDADLVLWPSFAQPYNGPVGLGPEAAAAAGGASAPVCRPLLVLVRGRVLAKAGRIVAMDAPGSTNGVQSRGGGEYCSGTAFPRHIYRLVFASENLQRQCHEIRGQVSGGILSPNTSNLLSDRADDHKQGNCSASPHNAHSSSSSSSATATAAAACDNSPFGHGNEVKQTGRRNLHASGFSFSGAQIDDGIPQRSTIRTHHPPGGSSNNPLW